MEQSDGADLICRRSSVGALWPAGSLLQLTAARSSDSRGVGPVPAAGARGAPALVAANGRWMSGWMVNRIQSWSQRMRTEEERKQEEEEEEEEEEEQEEEEE